MTGELLPATGANAPSWGRALALAETYQQPFGYAMHIRAITAK